MGRVIQKSRGAARPGKRAGNGSPFGHFWFQQSRFLRSWWGRFLFIPVLVALLTAHPAIAIALGISIALVTVIALRERWYGRPF